MKFEKGFCRKLPETNSYFVTCEGDVFSSKRKQLIKINSHSDKDGYQRVQLYITKRKTRFAIHRLVLCLFERPPLNGEEVSHVDGDKLNNKLTNLCWETSKQNNNRKILHGTIANGSKNGNSKLTEIQVLEILKRINNKENQRNIAKDFNITAANVTSIKLGKSWLFLKERFL